MSRHLLALALLLACVPTLAAPPTEAELAAADAKVAEGQAVAQQGDEAGALRLYGEAVRLAQNAEMAHKLGHLYEGRTQLPDHQARALEWFLYAAELKQPDAMHHVGERYLEGKGGLARDFGKGLALMQASASAGYEPAFGVASRIRKQQDDKARCLLVALRRHGMRDAPFSSGKLFQILSGEGREAAGDVYRISGLDDGFGASLATLDVRGFKGASYNEIGGRAIYTDVYESGPASPDGERLAMRLRGECGLAE